MTKATEYATYILLLLTFLIVSPYNIAQAQTVRHPERSYSTGSGHCAWNAIKTMTTRKTLSREEKQEALFTGMNTLYIGPQPDTLWILEDTVQEGTIMILGEGVLIVDDARLTLLGHMIQKDKGKAVFRNGAYWFIPQQYNSQYLHFLMDSACFDAENCTIFANTVQQVRHYGSSEYIARNTHFPHWNFHKLWDGSRLILQDADMVGDLTINDSCQIHFTRCDTLLPWFGIGAGESVDIVFPEYSFVDQYEFSSETPGVQGIHYSVTFDSCGYVMWGCESWKESHIRIRNTNNISVAFRFTDTDTMVVNDIHSVRTYSSLEFPFQDRVCEIQNSWLRLWFPYLYDRTVLYMDSCSYGESIAGDESQAYATHTTAIGFPSSADATENGYYSFKDGECRTFVSAWHDGVVLLENTRVIPKPRASQSINLVHGRSRLLAVNSYFEYEPEALDTALVMFTAIDSPMAGALESQLDIYGSAWIDAGPYHPAIFDRYALAVSPAGNSTWTLVQESTDEIHHDILASWNTSGMDAGEYNLRLTVWTSEQDSLTAYNPITLSANTGLNPESHVPDEMVLLQNYPNPFNPSTIIPFELNHPSRVVINVYNIMGRYIVTLIDHHLPAGAHHIPFNGSDYPGGLYILQMQCGNETIIKRMVLIK